MAVGHHNRYELLFMDDNDISDPSDNFIVKTKKQAKNVAATAASAAINATSGANVKAVTASAPQLQTPPAVTNKSPKKHRADDNQKVNNKSKLQQQQTEKENKHSMNNNKYEGGRQKKSLHERSIIVKNDAIATNQAVLTEDVNRNRALQQQPRASGLKQQQNANSASNINYNDSQSIQNQKISATQSTNGSGNTQTETNRPFFKAGNSGKNRGNFEGGSNRKREFDRHSGSDKIGKERRL